MRRNKTVHANSDSDTTNESKKDNSEQPPLYCQHKECYEVALFAANYCATHIVIDKKGVLPKHRHMYKWLKEIKARGGAIGTPDTRPNFPNAVFGGTIIRNLRGLVFLNCCMIKARFLNVIIDNSHFINCDLTEARFVNSSLEKISVHNCILRNTEFEMCDMTKARIKDIKFEDSILKGGTSMSFLKATRLNNIKIIRCMLEDVDFSRAKLTNINFIGPCHFKNILMTKKQLKYSVKFDKAAETQSTGSITLVDPPWIDMLKRIHWSLGAALHKCIVGWSPLVFTKWILACFLMAGTITLVSLGAVHSIGLAKVTTTSFWVLTGILAATIVGISVQGYRRDPVHSALRTGYPSSW